MVSEIMGPEEVPVIITFLDQWNPQLSNTDCYTNTLISKEKNISHFSVEVDIHYWPKHREKLTLGCLTLTC